MDTPRMAALSVLLVVAVLSSPADPEQAAGGTTLYVAPGGDDSWSGTLPAPNTGGTDGPLATLTGARDTIRGLKVKGATPAGGVTVIVRGGVYLQAQSLELTAEDSGGRQSPVVFQAAPDEEVRLMGGQIVPPEAFRPVTDEAVNARLDVGARGEVLQAAGGAFRLRVNYGAGLRPEDARLFALYVTE